MIEVLVPTHHNDKRRNYEQERRAFEQFLVKEHGGFTRLPVVEGAWRDGEYVMTDTMVPYRVAVTQDLDGVVAMALNLFHDQKSIFVAYLGAARVVERAAKPAEEQ